MPQFYAQVVGYPLRSADRDQIDTAARAAAAQGADVLLQLDPRDPLASLTAGQAADLAASLDTLATDIRTNVAVDFAPEMNGSWVTWGQQPKAYVAAFDRVARAVHARHSARLSTVWQPASGAGYPFGGARGDVRPSGPRVVSQLDTTGDGKVTEADDAYGPYWPGSAAVDRVGLSAFWFGAPGALGTDTVAPANWFTGMLTGTAGYATPQTADRNFVGRFSTATGKPLTVETGALVLASSAAPRARAVAQGWIGQVLSPATLAAVPTLDTVAWLEQRRPEDEAGGRLVDWRVTTDPAVRTTLRSALRADGVVLGAVPAAGGQSQANSAAGQVYAAAGSPDSQSDRILVGVAVLAALFLLAGLATRLRRSWRYPVGDDPDRGSPDTRDGRVDLLRGFVMCAVVVTHIGLAGPLSWFVGRAGALTGAEMFVLLSGVVLGSLYPRLAARQGSYAAAVQMLRRAAVLYGKTLAVILLIFFVVKIPGVDGTPVTTFTDRGTGMGGSGAAGRVYYLYGTAQHLLDYPPPGYAVKDLLLLRYGPWPMNILGLFVLLSAAVPACMWLVRRGLWWLLLAISWGLYALEAVHHVPVLGAQFDSVFPLLAWQVAFTHGLVIGRYRVRIAQALRSTAGLVATGGVLAAYLAGLLTVRAGVHLPGVPGWSTLYDRWYERTELQGGRLVDMVVFAVVAYAFLTACWTPLHATLGRLFEPIGRASLTSFFVQVYLVLIIGNLPHLSEHSAWQGFLVQAAALAVVWVVARRPWVRAPKDDSRAPAVTSPTPERLVGAGR